MAFLTDVASPAVDPRNSKPGDGAAQWAGWEAFVAARSADALCDAWLAVLAERIAGVGVAAVLIENLDDRSYVPIAVWPRESSDLGRLAGVVEQALRERRGVVLPHGEPPVAIHLAYPVMVGEQIGGIVVVESDCAEWDVGAIFREMHWGSAWLSNLLAGRELGEAVRERERVGSVLEVTAVALRHGKLQQALFEVANTLRQRFACARVAIGLAEQSSIKLVALSEAATFEKHAALVKAYQQAMDETFDEGRALVSPIATSGSGELTPKHANLRAISGAGAVLSHPLLMGAKCVGVLTLERENTPFGPDDLAWMEAFSALAAPIIDQRREAEYGAGRRLGRDFRDVLEKIFGPRHLTWKAASATLALLLVLLILLPIQYRVSAKTVIEGEVQRVVAAPFEGFIGSAHARAGDLVKAEQLLAQLDDRELRIEEARWSSERDQYENRLREAMANHDLTAMQVVGAQLRQATAQLALVREKIVRARLVAPFDGVVVSGDLSQQVGAPAEAGKKLFEIAPLLSYRIILQVDEREIRHLQTGQAGRLVMTGIAGEAMEFTVAKVTPVATALEGRNFFRVEAALAEASPRLRPGMEGVGKVEVGSHSLWWVLTHSFTDWLTLALWNWMP